jgi:signal transduction histidine kinase
VRLAQAREAVRLRRKLTGHRLRPRLPRRTVRVRLAALFFAVFLASGAALLAVTVAVWQGRTGGGTTHAPAGSLLHPAIGVTQHGSDRHQLLIASGIAFAIMAGASLAVGWLVAGRFPRPLRTITATTREISATNLQQRLNLVGPDDELKELGDTFDDLLARLERSFDFERQFVANASHELRTPLATMRASLDVAMSKPGPLPPQIVTLADRLRREFDHVDRLLESFLTLAHAQHGPAADESTLSLADLASTAIERRSGAISLLSLTLNRDEFRQACVGGSATLLSRMVENVIDNAINHNQPGGWVRVQTAVEGPVARIIVENGGPVLAQQEVEQLVQPFRRLGAQRTGSEEGSGLGLSIVSTIAEAHGGTVDLQALRDGGLRVVIALPLAVATRAGAQA